MTTANGNIPSQRYIHPSQQVLPHDTNVCAHLGVCCRALHTQPTQPTLACCQHWWDPPAHTTSSHTHDVNPQGPQPACGRVISSPQWLHQSLALWVKPLRHTPQMHVSLPAVPGGQVLLAVTITNSTVPTQLLGTCSSYLRGPTCMTQTIP